MNKLITLLTIFLTYNAFAKSIACDVNKLNQDIIFAADGIAKTSGVYNATSPESALYKTQNISSTIDIDGSDLFTFEVARIVPYIPFPNCVYAPKILVKVNQYSHNDYTGCMVVSTEMAKGINEPEWVKPYCLKMN